MKSKIMCSLLVMSVLLSVCVVPAAAAFRDVPDTAWYAQDVSDVEAYGILQGKGNGTFDPNGNLTLAEAITMAARTYAYERGEMIPSTNSSVWYTEYLQYANQNGICALGEFGTAYNNFCNRITMAKLFARVLLKDTEAQLNDVTALPDVQYNAENMAVFYLYQQGVLTGSDKYGTFHPYQYIKRSETAAILNRVLNAQKRKTFTLQPTPDLEVVRYGTENGRLKEVPPVNQVVSDLDQIGCSGYIVIETIETGGFYSPKYGMYATQLSIDVYDKPWEYAGSLTVYYIYTYDERGGHDFWMDMDNIEVYYSEISCDLTKSDYLYMNEMDKQYYGTRPTLGIPWCNPNTGEWTLDGVPYEGGLYWW